MHKTRLAYDHVRIVGMTCDCDLNRPIRSEFAVDGSDGEVSTAHPSTREDGKGDWIPRQGDVSMIALKKIFWELTRIERFKQRQCGWFRSISTPRDHQSSTNVHIRERKERKWWKKGNKQQDGVFSNTIGTFYAKNRMRICLADEVHVFSICMSSVCPKMARNLPSIGTRCCSVEPTDENRQMFQIWSRK